MFIHVGSLNMTHTLLIHIYLLHLEACNSPLPQIKASKTTHQKPEIGSKRFSLKMLEKHNFSKKKKKKETLIILKIIKL